MNAHALGQLHTMQLAEVIDNVDPDRRGRIKIRLHAAPLETWANMVTTSAGQNYGVACLPKVGENVVIAFINQDTPLIMGSIWAGQDSLPDEFTDEEEQYVIQTPNGTVCEFNDSDGPKFNVRTQSGYQIEINEGNGGEITLERGSQKITLTPSEIEITSSGPVSINAAKVNVSASMVQVDAGMSKFSGVVQCDTIIATSVVGTTYTPGAGNIW